MSSILRRTLLLSFSRFATQAIVLFSPFLLVRILSVEEYGKYREFLLYAGMIAAFVTFGIRNSLAYLVPKYPEQERVWITQTILYTLASSTIAVVVLMLVGDLVRARTSFDFVTALQLYVIFFANLDFIEFYWLSKKRTDKVLYYSLSHLFARLVILILSAYFTRDATRIVASLIALEFLRCLLVFCYALWRRWFTTGFGRDSLVLQGSYFLPLGAGAVLEVLNHNIGMLFVSIMMGVEALAFFVIGALATQIANVLRGAIADVVFPEIVSLRKAEPRDALPLWKQATVWYCILLFPTATFFMYYADAIVTVLFTPNYSAAIPVFATYAVLLFVFCFDFHLPLRVQNANKYFFFGSGLALITNLVLLYPTYRLMGLVGPAVSAVFAQVVVTIYLGYWVTRVYSVKWSEVADWQAICKVALASLICVPVLIIGKCFVESYFWRGFAFGLLYLGCYFAFLRCLGVWDAWELIARFGRFRNGLGQ